MAEPIYRTTYKVEVFSEGPFQPNAGPGDPFDLETINYEICEGPCIGNVEMVSAEVVPPEQVEAELLRIGNDGSFFEDPFEVLMVEGFDDSDD